MQMRHSPDGYWKLMPTHGKLKFAFGNLLIGAIILLLLLRGWFSAPLALLIATLIYNFDFGHQKGHYLHLLLICTTGIVVLVCCFLKGSTAMYASGATIIACIVIMLSKMDVIKLVYADYYAGVKRDHFTGANSIFR